MCNIQYYSRPLFPLSIFSSLLLSLRLYQICDIHRHQKEHMYTLRLDILLLGTRSLPLTKDTKSAFILRRESAVRVEPKGKQIWLADGVVGGHGRVAEIRADLLGHADTEIFGSCMAAHVVHQYGRVDEVT